MMDLSDDRDLLTQEEIDALLREVEAVADAEQTETTSELAAEERDAILQVLAAFADVVAQATQTALRQDGGQLFIRTVEAIQEQLDERTLQLSFMLPGEETQARMLIGSAAWSQLETTQAALQAALPEAVAFTLTAETAETADVTPVDPQAPLEPATAPWLEARFTADDQPLRLMVALTTMRQLLAALSDAAHGDATPGDGAAPASSPETAKQASVPTGADMYPELDPAAAAISKATLELLYDVPLELTVELGSAKRKVSEVLELASGSILELDKLAGDPVDILVNGQLIARGEVVVVDEYFGVRVTDIVSRAERLQKLR